MSRAGPLCVSSVKTFHFYFIHLEFIKKTNKQKNELDCTSNSYKLVLTVKELFLCFAKKKQLLLMTQATVDILLEEHLA